MRGRTLLLVLVLVLAASVLEPAAAAQPRPMVGTDVVPEQRTATAGSGLVAEPPAEPARDPPRPLDAVPDRVEVPPVLPPERVPVDVVPEVVPVPRAGGLDARSGVERVEERTARTETFTNADGTRTLRVHAADSHVRQPDGSFAPVDLGLVDDGRGGLRPVRAPVGVRFAAAAAEVSFGDAMLGMGVADAADVVPEVVAATATYRGVRPGVDLRLTSSALGFEEAVVLSAPVGSVTSVLRLTGLRPEVETGAVRFTDAGGEVRAHLPAAVLVDADGVRSAEVRHVVEERGGSWTLRADLDREWLADPSRAYPVVLARSASHIDTDADDTYVRAGAGNASSAPDLRAGRVDGESAARSYLHFGRLREVLRDRYVVGATLNVVNIWSGSCTARPVTVFEVAEPWRGGTARWPGAAVGEALSTRSFAHGQPCGGPVRAALPFDQDKLVRVSGWTHGAPFHGLGLRAANEGDAGAGKRFASADAAAANAPFLDIVHSAEGAAYAVDGVTLPDNANQGEIRATVTNLGSSSWPAGGGFRLGYEVIRDGKTIATSPGVGPLGDVAPMGEGAFKVPVQGVPPGEYEVRISMRDPQGRDFHLEHSLPYARFAMQVRNTPPASDRQQPGSGASVESLTPSLYAEGVDPDRWPGQPFKYRFRLCADALLTKDCHESGWGPQVWAPPRDALRWGTTYHWSVKVHDGVSESPDWHQALVLTTKVPQPQITSHLAGSVGSAEPAGLGVQVGNFTTAATDASVATAGPGLTVTRTYNSLDPRRDTAFGIGWSSPLDMRLREDDDGSGGIVATLATGRQIRLGRNPDTPDGRRDYAPPPGQNTTLVHDSRDGRYTLRDATGGMWVFDARLRLVLVVDPAGLRQRLDHDDHDHVVLITNETSDRWLRLTWKGAHVETIRTDAPEPGAQPLVWTYRHEEDRLVQACAPGGAPHCATYHYETGSHYRASVLDDNPRAYWRLSETGTDVATNVVARKPGADEGRYRAVVQGSGGAVGGTADRAATFDGSSSHVLLPERLTADTMSLSVELWFRTTDQGVLVSYADRAIPAEARQHTPVLYIGTDGLLYGGFAMREVVGLRQVASRAPVNDDRWHHAVVSAAIDRQVLLLDGEPQGEARGLVDHGDRTHLALGSGSGRDWPATSGADFPFRGDIDEVALYRHPLGTLAARQHRAVGRSADLLTKVTLPQDDRVLAQVTYDDHHGRVRTLTDHTGREWTLDPPVRDEAKREVVLRGPGVTRRHAYDADNRGRPVSRWENGRVRRFEYNAKDFGSAEVDENGHRTEWTTDDRGNVLSEKTCRTKDACHTTYHTYHKASGPLDPRGDKPASTSDARSSGPDDQRYRTTYDYDDLGRPIRTTSPAPRGSTSRPVETSTWSTGTEDALGGGTVPAGLLIRTTGKRDQVTTHDHRANGDLARTTSATGLRTEHAHDRIGRVKSTTVTNRAGADYGTTTYTYTPRSQPETVTGPRVVNPVTGVVHSKVTTYRYDGNGNTTQVTVSDAVGGDRPRTTTFGYDAHDRLATITFPDGGVRTTSYEDDGFTEVLTDVRGFRWTSQFDERGLLSTLTAVGSGVDPQDPRATTLTVESRGYDDAGRLAWVTDAMGRRTTYGYYDDNLPATVTRNGYVDPDGRVRDVVVQWHGYDPAGNRTLLVEAGDRHTTTEYDDAGHVWRETTDPDRLKRVTTYARDRAGNAERVELTGAADPGRVEATRYSYDATDLVLREDAEVGPGVALSTIHERDERGLVLRSTNRRLHSTSYSYDATGALVATTAPPVDAWVGGVHRPGFAGAETLGRNTFGEVTHVRDAAGGVTRTEHDVMGRITAELLPDHTPPGGEPIKDAATKTEYDFAGNATKVTDPLGRVTTRAYDPYGRVLTTTEPEVDGVVATSGTTYTRAGEVRTTTSATGAEQRFTYDELGRRITATAVERRPAPTAYHTTTTGYDDAGNATSTRTPRGHTSTAEHNKAGEVVRQVDATGRATLLGHDDAGRLTSVTDPASLVTRFHVDPVGRLTGWSEWVAGVERRRWRVEPDENGNVVSTTSPAGRTTTAVHDALDRVVARSERVDEHRSIDVELGYDPLGHLSRQVDGEKRVTVHTSNARGERESTADPGGATWTTSYDAAGQAVRQIAPGGVERTREFDARGRLTVERGAGAEAATAERRFGYDADNRLVRVGGPLGEATYDYDDRGNLVGTGGAAGEATYTYHPEGDLASRTDAAGRASFEYDAAGRLALVEDPVTGARHDFTYDTAGRPETAAGRRISHDDLGRTKTRSVTGFTVGYTYDDDDKVKTRTTNGATESYDYDGAGRLTSWTDTTGHLTTYGWDLAGNRTSVGATTYSYDERDRLRSGGGATHEYTDRGTLSSTTADGRTREYVSDGFDRMTRVDGTTYRYDALDRVADRNGVPFRYAGLSNELVSDGARLVGRLPDGTALADKAVDRPGALLFADQHGDVVARHLGTAIAGSRAFDPFGRVLTETGENATIGYQGDWTDPGTGLVDMTARWYRPATGSFTTRDDRDNHPAPSGAANRYAYGNNDPVSTSDPSGHFGVALAPLVQPMLHFLRQSVLYVARQAARQVARQGRFIFKPHESGAGGSGGGGSSSGGGGLPIAPVPVPARRDHAEPPQPPPGPREPKNPGGAVITPTPPPPPPWLVHAMKPLRRPVDGTTVQVPAQEVVTTPTLVVDLGQERYNKARKTTYVDRADDRTRTDHDFAEDQAGCLRGHVPHTIWYGSLDHLGRATGAGGCLTQVRPNKKNKITAAVPGHDAGDEYATARGHLVAHSFFGENRRQNLVPLNQPATNSSMMWHGVESKVYARVAAGERVHYRVAPAFYGNELVPRGIGVEVTGSSGYYCKIYIPNLVYRPDFFKGCPP
ncbi:RHS repeat-associated core domain-containing protein [Saccharothrix obliqua]|uniref:RHS repeat-associated core domain-containing protein n=1 Tax=Saccharothrix obliqua TaxID=2861747 RepID=UPI001C5FBE41|nr:RHS repeat-associated core domain-containing protein [Saccharothrix obliqua]MBW4717893.1 DNA/RNA non-specific endonuclease [Saccharothrix obliqua]